MDVGEAALTKEDQEPAAAHEQLLPPHFGCLLLQIPGHCLQLTPAWDLNAQQIFYLQLNQCHNLDRALNNAKKATILCLGNPET